MKNEMNNIIYLPQFFPINWIDEFNILGISFTKEIGIGFVNRFEGGYSYMSKEEFKILNIKSSELLKKAIENLKNGFESCEIKIYHTDIWKEAFWQSESDNFTSVRILIEGYYSLIQENLSKNFKFSIPSRDIITCWISDSIEKDQQNIDETIEDYNNEEYNLSPKVYEWKDIQIYSEIENSSFF
jgi:hypothetical protein